jgi:hypothetical protein
MTPEDIAQMAPMLVLAGLAVGWAAEVASRAGGHGFLADLGVAVAGSVIGGGIVWVAISTNVGMMSMFGIGCLSAALVIVAQRVLWPSTRPRI